MIACRFGMGFDPHDDVGKYLVGQRGDQYAYRVTGRAGEQIRGAIGYITKLLGDAEDALSKPFRYRFRVA